QDPPAPGPDQVGQHGQGHAEQDETGARIAQAPSRRPDVEPPREEEKTRERQQKTDDDSEGRFHRAGDPERALSSAREAGTPQPARRAQYTGSRRTKSILPRRARLPKGEREAILCERSVLRLGGRKRSAGRPRPGPRRPSRSCGSATAGR